MFCEVENIGNELSRDIKVRLKVRYGDGVILEEYRAISELLPGQKVILSFSPYTPQNVGDYIFEFSSDAPGDINTTNNYKSVFCGCEIGLSLEEKGVQKYDINVVDGGLMLNNGYVHIYSVDGRTIFRGKGEFIPLRKGFYFLKVGGKTLKVFIR